MCALVCVHVLFSAGRMRAFFQLVHHDGVIESAYALSITLSRCRERETCTKRSVRIVHESLRVLFCVHTCLSLTRRFIRYPACVYPIKTKACALLFQTHVVSPPSTYFVLYLPYLDGLPCFDLRGCLTNSRNTEQGRKDHPDSVLKRLHRRPQVIQHAFTCDVILVWSH